MIEPLALQPLPAAAEALRADVRSFLDDALAEVPADVRARSWLGFDAAFSRALGARGWIGLALPREYGGGGRDAFARFVLVEELLARGAPVLGALDRRAAERADDPALRQRGAEARSIVPRVCRGEVFFCIGMSEPQAGSDLASVRTRATPTARVGGSRARRSGRPTPHHSHYMIALVRTSGTPEDRQRGLSQLLIDLKTPGITVRPIEDLTGDTPLQRGLLRRRRAAARRAARQPRARAGQQVTAELAFERSGPERLYSSIVLFDAWLDAPARDAERRSCGARARRPHRRPHSRRCARCRSRSPRRSARGASPMTEASLVKDLGTELEQFMPLAIADAVASARASGDAASTPPRAAAHARLHDPVRADVLAARRDARESLRGLIARGLGAADDGTDDDTSSRSRSTRLLADACTPATVRAIEGGEPTTGALWSRARGLRLPRHARARSLPAVRVCASPMRSRCSRSRAPRVPLPVAHTMLARALLGDAGVDGAAGSDRDRERRRSSAHDGAISCPGPRTAASPTAVVVPTAERLARAADRGRRTTPRAGVHGSLRADLRWPALPAACDRRARRRSPGAKPAPRLAAALLAGALQRVLEMTVAFANDRIQFGTLDRQVPGDPAPARGDGGARRRRPHGGARSAARATARCPLPLRAALAKARASEAASLAAPMAHAVHGAIGITAELDLQLYTRRLHELARRLRFRDALERVLGRALLDRPRRLALDFMRERA